MFEVGNNYINGMGTVARCLAETDKMAILEVDKPSSTASWSVGQQFMCYQNDMWSTWKEYREPVVVKVIRAVIQNKDGNLSTPRLNFVDPSDNLVGKIEVTVTDGKLTDVEIL